MTAGSVYFYIDGIPAVSSFVVRELPLSIDNKVGEELHRTILKNATINEQKSTLLKSFFSELKYDPNTEIYVVDAPVFNAFALPDNSIFVFSEVLKEVHSYPELAALLGHEYSHIKRRHGIKLLAQGMARDLIADMVTGDDNSSRFLQNANKLLDLKNSRDFESQADLGALDLLKRKHIDLNGTYDLLDRIERLGKEQKVKIPTYLSTHPDTGERKRKVEDEIKKMQNIIDQNDELDRVFCELKK